MTFQEFTLIKQRVEKIKDENELSSSSDAFYFFALDKLFNLQEDEIDGIITDTAYLTRTSNKRGHDRGIDAIHICDDEKKPVIYLFSFKYTDDYNKASVNNYPSNEIDKISSFIDNLMNKNESIIASSNSVLNDKVKEIWDLMLRSRCIIKICLCSNYFKMLEEGEFKRFKVLMSKFKDIEIIQHNSDTFVKYIHDEERKIINVKFRTDKSLIDKPGGKIRALILSIKATELVRIICGDEKLREELDNRNFADVINAGVEEDLFYDNVRKYQSSDNRINKSIISTAKSDDRKNFFYYNNGITITCDRLEYSSGAYPIVELENIQIVNGCQTLHSLFEVGKSQYENLDDIEILCRIYELKQSDLSSKIAEYTNSQSPVKTRDIRAIDYIQLNLDAEFKGLELFYERKKGQYEDQPKKKRYDSEKVGQVLMAFYSDMPCEARNSKSILFADKYDSVFNQSITAKKVLFAYDIYSFIEQNKKDTKKIINEDVSKYNDLSFVLYSSYYILYTISKLCKKNGISPDSKIKDGACSFYLESLSILKKAIEKDKSLNGEKFNNTSYFKSMRVKGDIDSILLL